MDVHIRRLGLSIWVAHNINNKNLEFYWYGVWDIILNYWFSHKFIIIPQYEILYTFMDRDDNRIIKSLVPDFVVVGYNNNATKEYVKLVIENKRTFIGVNMEEKIAKMSEQLHEQVGTIFMNSDYDRIHGIVSVGKFWKWYMYDKVDMNSHKRSWSDTSYKDETTYNYDISYSSKILDISSAQYNNDFKELTKLIV